MYKRIIVTLILVFFIFGCAEEKKLEENPKQEVTKAVDEFEVNVDEAPLPVGGVQTLASKITYPSQAKQNGVQGTVFIKAFIDEEGNVLKTEIIKSIGYGCDEAAQDAVSKTQFTPGRKNGVAVKVQVSIPIKFKLE